MSLSPVFVLILLQLCSLQLVALARPSCKLLQGDLVLQVHNTLRDLGGSFPVQCESYKANISFPGSAFPNTTANQAQCCRVSCVLYETLRRAELIFQDNDAPVGVGGVNWDNKKLDDFEFVLHRVVEEGRCVSSPDVSAVLSSYFSAVTAILQQEDSAICGWLALRSDLLKVLRSTMSEHSTCLIWRDMTTRGHAH